jgi:hypothetical protein
MNQIVRSPYRSLAQMISVTETMRLILSVSPLMYAGAAWGYSFAKGLLSQADHKGNDVPAKQDE